MQQLKNKNNYQQHASTARPRLTFYTPTPHSSPRLSPRSICESALRICILAHLHLHLIASPSYTYIYTMFAPALLRTARPAASRIAPIAASRLASSSTKLTIANENFPLPTGEEVDPQCTSLRRSRHTHHHMPNTNAMHAG